MNFYKKHIGAYAKKTAHLSLMEHGAYNLLMDACYGSEGPLPPDKQSLYKLCRATTAAERRAVDKVADEFFPVNGDGRRHNERCDEELAAYRKQCNTNRDTAIAREAARREHEHSTKRDTNVGTKEGTNAQPNSEFRSKKQAEPDGSLDPLWGVGLQTLQANGISEAQARSFIGLMLASWESAYVLEALQAAAGKADPRGYVRAVLKDKPKKGEAQKKQVVM